MKQGKVGCFWEWIVEEAAQQISPNAHTSTPNMWLAEADKLAPHLFLKQKEQRFGRKQELNGVEPFDVLCQAVKRQEMALRVWLGDVPASLVNSPSVLQAKLQDLCFAFKCSKD